MWPKVLPLISGAAFTALVSVTVVQLLAVGLLVGAMMGVLECIGSLF